MPSKYRSWLSIAKTDCKLLTTGRGRNQTRSRRLVAIQFRRGPVIGAPPRME
jgi:hypothetical protein